MFWSCLAFTLRRSVELYYIPHRWMDLQAMFWDIQYNCLKFLTTRHASMQAIQDHIRSNRILRRIVLLSYRWLTGSVLATS